MLFLVRPKPLASHLNCINIRRAAAEQGLQSKDDLRADHGHLKRRKEIKQCADLVLASDISITNP